MKSHICASQVPICEIAGPRMLPMLSAASSMLAMNTSPKLTCVSAVLLIS